MSDIDKNTEITDTEEVEKEATSDIPNTEESTDVDNIPPIDSEQIINGTNMMGGLGSLLGNLGNSADYGPMFKSLTATIEQIDHNTEYMNNRINDLEFKVEVLKKAVKYLSNAGIVSIAMILILGVITIISFIK